MKDSENVNCGDLETLKILGENKKNDYTTEQLLDENLKNLNGESNIEVRKRMLDFFKYVLGEHEGKKIAIVSHGAAIKFLLQNWCEYDYENNSFVYRNKKVCSANLESPSILKLTFENDDLVQIEKCR